MATRLFSVPYFLSLLNHYSWWPVHLPTLAKHGDPYQRNNKWTRPGNFVGNGPFVLDTWKVGHVIVVKKNPLARVAKEPKRYQVSFLAKKAPDDIVPKLEAAAAKTERFVVDGREIYAWHPETIARSRLWTLLAGPGLGVAATARNWTTVTKLLELAT